MKQLTSNDNVLLLWNMLVDANNDETSLKSITIEDWLVGSYITINPPLR